MAGVEQAGMGMATKRLRMKLRVVLSGLVAIAVLALSVPHTSAQSTALPPPPNVSFPEAGSAAPDAANPPATSPDFVPNGSSPSPAETAAPIAPQNPPLLERPAAIDATGGFQPSLPAPTPNNEPATGAVPAVKRYFVYVNGDSPYLLQEVQKLVPTAFVQAFRGQSVIQTGSFDSEASARQQIANLKSQGIWAEMASDTIAATAVSAVSAPAPANSPYVVVIPAEQADWTRLTNQAVQLGIQQGAIQTREAPIGPHLAIGPYSEQGQAEEVSRYLRRNGMDARVVFRP